MKERKPLEMAQQQASPLSGIDLSKLTFKNAFGATMGFYLAQFIAGLMGLAAFAAFLCTVGWFIKHLVTT